MLNPFTIPDDEKAARMAAERTRKLRENEGMFAEFVEPVTAEQIQEAARRHRDRFQATMDVLQLRGEAFKARVFFLVSQNEMTAMEEQRAKLPDGPEFHSDFWRRALKRITNACQDNEAGVPDALPVTKLA